MNRNWPKGPKTTKMQTQNHNNYLRCKGPGASVAQSID